MTPEKQNKLKLYFDSLTLPESQWLIREEFGLTDNDVYEYQKMKEKEVSMKPGKKRDLIVKEVVKPLLKAHGFKCKGLSWFKELEDSWLIVHMKSSRFNCGLTGCNFEFLFSVSAKDEVKDSLENQWIYNQVKDINQSAFLPYCGYLSLYMNVLGYQIDGYRNYLPTDEPVENIMKQIKEDFEQYILPAIDQIHNKGDWQRLEEEVEKRYREIEVVLLRYFDLAVGGSCSDHNMRRLIDIQKKMGLTKEDITSHFDLLEKFMEHHAQPRQDVKSYILRSLELQEEE